MGTETVKTCRRCGEEKPGSDFHRRAAAKDGLHSYCRPCNKDSVRDYRNNLDPRQIRNYHFRTRYGITVDEYEAMLAEQGNVCAVCGESNEQLDKRNGRHRSLHVDHDHKTGNVRGLLCANCNTAIGLSQDSPERLRQMADYLERSK